MNQGHGTGRLLHAGFEEAGEAGITGIVDRRSVPDGEHMLPFRFRQEWQAPDRTARIVHHPFEERSEVRRQPLDRRLVEQIDVILRSAFERSGSSKTIKVRSKGAPRCSIANGSRSSLSGSGHPSRWAGRSDARLVLGATRLVPDQRDLK